MSWRTHRPLNHLAELPPIRGIGPVAGPSESLGLAEIQIRGAATVSSGLHPTSSQNRTRLSMTRMKKKSTYLLSILSICRTPAAEAAGSPATKILACSSSLRAIDTTGRSDVQDVIGRSRRSSICVSMSQSPSGEMTQVTLASCRSCRIASSRRLQAVSLRSASTVGASSTPEWNHVRMIV